MNPDESKFKHITSLGMTIASMTYVFPPASGKYKGRQLEISPSYYPFVISYIGFGGMVDDALMRQLNPSPSLRIATHDSSFKYLVISMEMKVDIGTPSIMFYPKSVGSKIGSLLSLKRAVKTQYESFNEKYTISLKKGQEWFLDCLDINTVNYLLQLELPKLSGAVFQFSKKHATFAIVPRSIGKDKLKAVLEILDRIAVNIENRYKI